jgi:8-demethyl-8-alpha-L-rhamnosyltetracenomycin-C 2'-O-methyltransferase
MESLHEIGLRTGTDKASIHSYLPIYEEMLGHLRNEPITLLEIGVAMGQSLAMWLEYFPKAVVCGLDNNLPTIKGPERLRIFKADQSDERALFRLSSEMAFDVIIDDGSHQVTDQLLTCHALWRALKLNGLYFVEDIQSISQVAYWRMMPGFQFWAPLKDGRADDILVMMRKLK